MGNSYKETHDAILLSAKNNFLAKGFERANLRQICRDANVTTGAFYRHFKDKEDIFEELVAPVIKEMKKCYFYSEHKLYKSLAYGDNDRIWDVADETIIYFVDLIYENYNGFKLLLSCSDGTKYENIVHNIATMETIHTIKFMNNLRENGYKVKDISENELHMLTEAYFRSIFEVIIHDYNRDEAIKCIKTVVNFNKIGWKHIFGM